MIRRRKNDVKDRTAEIREQAKEIAGQSGEALKDFADSTGVAAKEFATKAKDAAKELVDAIEKAAKRVEQPEPRRGRKVLKRTVLIGAGIALLSSERVRESISSAIRRNRGGPQQPEVWRPEPVGGNGEVRQPVTTEGSTS